MKDITIVSVRKNSPNKIVYTDEQMEKLYEIAERHVSGSLSKEDMILELRGRGFGDVVLALGVIAALIAYNLRRVEGFVPTRPPHLELWYGDQKPRAPFGYGNSEGPNYKNTKVAGVTQTAGLDQNQPSSWSYKYRTL